MQNQFPGLSITILLCVVAAIFVLVGAVLHRQRKLTGRGPVLAWAVVCALPLLAAFYWPVAQSAQDGDTPSYATDGNFS